mgnify:FL=1|jgi:hypothetical protein|tara:strand:+ start:93 stop:470 length:378 start_codon:yes stop_codon:yes gene_type:complete
MDYTVNNNTSYSAPFANSNSELNLMYNSTVGNVSLGTSSPNEKLHINNTIISQPMNNQNQIKVAIFKIEKVENKVTSSEMIHEGWLDRTNKKDYMSIDLQAAKEFNISYDDLDKIVVKEILGVNF